MKNDKLTCAVCFIFQPQMARMIATTRSIDASHFTDIPIGYHFPINRFKKLHMSGKMANIATNKKE